MQRRRSVQWFLRRPVLWLASVTLSCASPQNAAHPDRAASSTPEHQSEPAREPGQPGHDHRHKHTAGKDGLHMDFSDVERFAAHFDDPERDAWQKPAEVLDVIGLIPGHTVVDLGAGTGYFLPHLSERAGPSGKVLALDVEPNMVEHMKRRATEAGLLNVQARVIAPDSPGLAAASVDRILIVNTWHHISDRVEYGKQLYQALMPGGNLAIVDFTLEAKIGPPPSHRLSATEVSNELAAAGFQPRIAEETLPNQYIVLGAR